MRILAVSDVPSPVLLDSPDEKDRATVDLILSCGDLPPEYLTALTHAYKAPLYYVCGNHDLRYKTNPPSGCTNLHGRIANVRGLKILGLEGSIWYNGGPYQYTERQMRTAIRHLRPLLWWRRGIDMVITHAPPRHIKDGDDLCHQGFKAFRWLIKKYKPAYFIHGHIHRDFSEPSERITMENSTRVINAFGFYLFENKESRHA